MIMSEEEMDEQIELMQEETISDFDMVESLNDRCANSECPSHNICDLCMYEMGRADAIEEYKHNLKETFNNEFPINYHSTQPYFTLDNVRVLADAVAREMKEQNNG